jgi:hypothetical protein
MFRSCLGRGVLLLTEGLDGGLPFALRSKYLFGVDQYQGIVQLNICRSIMYMSAVRFNG